ncbi:hypothetical protein Tco_0349830 [Tanacetum coccineum]
MKNKNGHNNTRNINARSNARVILLVINIARIDFYATKTTKPSSIKTTKPIMKREDASEFPAMINRRRLPTDLQEMFEKPKKKLRIRFAVRTPPINCKPVKKVLPCTSSVGSNDPDVILLDADDHDDEEEEVESARSVAESFNEDDLTHGEEAHYPTVICNRRR